MNYGFCFDREERRYQQFGDCEFAMRYLRGISAFIASSVNALRCIKALHRGSERCDIGRNPKLFS